MPVHPRFKSVGTQGPLLAHMDPEMYGMNCGRQLRQAKCWPDVKLKGGIFRRITNLLTAIFFAFHVSPPTFKTIHQKSFL